MTHDPAETNVAQRAMVAGRARGIYDEQAKERMHEGQDKGRASQRGSVVTLPQTDSAKARDLAGKAAGVSGTYVDAATRVLTRAVPFPSRRCARVAPARIKATKSPADWPGKWCESL